MPPSGSDWLLVFEDDFNSPAIDTAKWVRESAPVTDFGCFTISDSILRMMNDNVSYDFARLYTAGKFRFQYGYMETRMKHVAGKGYWGGFWTYQYDTPSTQVDEIDVSEEQGGSPTVHRMHYHYHLPTDYSVNYDPTYSPGTDWTQDFHVYAAEWTPTAVTFYVDGVEVATTGTSIGHAPTNIWIENQLDQAGVYGGPPDGTTPYPGYRDCDYVRVWQKTGWRGYARVQCSDVTVNDANFKAELLRLAISASITPNTKSHMRTVGVRDYVLEYAADQALTGARIANAIAKRLGADEATLLATLTVTTYAGDTWDERRAACKSALGL